MPCDLVEACQYQPMMLLLMALLANTDSAACCADFIVKNHGLDTEADYAYWGWGLFCNSLREGRCVEADLHQILYGSEACSMRAQTLHACAACFVHRRS